VTRRRTPKPRTTESDALLIMDRLFANSGFRPTIQAARGHGFHGNDYWWQECLQKWLTTNQAPKRTGGNAPAVPAPSQVEIEKRSAREVELAAPPRRKGREKLTASQRAIQDYKRAMRGVGIS
jgi:hypothetical protein